MKKHFAFILFILPFWCLAQEIKVNEVDGFTKERTIHTSIVSVTAAFAKGMGLSLSAVGSHYMVNVVGYGRGNGEVRATDLAYFLMDDGLILTAKSIGQQAENEGGITLVYQHHYLLRMKDIEDIRDKKVVLLRLTTPYGNVDTPISKKTAKQLKKLSEIFIKEVLKGMAADKA